MSLTQMAFLDRSRVPRQAELQAAIDALGFDLTVDDYYVPFEAAGFLPCKLDGADSGFEIDFDEAASFVADLPELAPVVGSRDCAITFTWGGDMAECACVLIVSAALAGSFDAGRLLRARRHAVHPRATPRRGQGGTGRTPVGWRLSCLTSASTPTPLRGAGYAPSVRHSRGRRGGAVGHLRRR